MSPLRSSSAGRHCGSRAAREIAERKPRRLSDINTSVVRLRAQIGLEVSIQRIADDFLAGFVETGGAASAGAHAGRGTRAGVLLKDAAGHHDVTAGAGDGVEGL